MGGSIHAYQVYRDLIVMRTAELRKQQIQAKKWRLFRVITCPHPHAFFPLQPTAVVVICRSLAKLQPSTRSLGFALVLVSRADPLEADAERQHIVAVTAVLPRNAGTNKRSMPFR